MELKQKERIALFRFGVINSLIGLRSTQRGEKERVIRDLVSKEWDIPFTGRSYISRSTILGWITRYKASGNNLTSLYPKNREDTGKCRVLDIETELALVNLKRELSNVGLPVLIKVARERNIIHADYKASQPTIYRIFRRHGVDKIEIQKEDRRRFESELPNDMWQSDCMHGPCVQVDGKEKKSYLFSFIDDHSRLIPYGEFYLQENLITFMECLKNALLKRGIPKKLYVDNGPTFRSHHLSHVTASLGIALIHAKPYKPEGKGKIERFHRTIRMQVLPLLPQKITLDELNKKFQNWIENEYHTTIHSVTQQSPLKRYLKHLHLIRSAPADLTDYFRIKTLRKVDKDRTIALNGKVYEAPTGLIGNTVSLMYHRNDTEKVEIFHNNKSYGFLVSLNSHINVRVKRNKAAQPVKEKTSDDVNGEIPRQAGELF